MFIWQRHEWPNITWDSESLLPKVGETRFAQGKFIGMMSSIGFDVRLHVELELSTQEAIMTSAIEGVVLDFQSVRSSLARKLGLDEEVTVLTGNRHLDGLAEVLLDATHNYDRPLTVTRLYDWHRKLFSGGGLGTGVIEVGKWRSQGMEIISDRERTANSGCISKLLHRTNWKKR